MADHYSILGLTKTATEIEIKTAFRRLAKIYHPDKNPNDPNAKHLFENILRAYNVLSNPHSRRRYDNNFSYSTQTTNKTQPRHHRNRGQKEWDVTEEELKRREYFKKHYHAKKHTVNEEAQKNQYSDYKYVLFATPIAVGLLMLIVSIFSSEPPTELIPKKTEPVSSVKAINHFSRLTNGDKPYRGHFGDLKMFDTKLRLQINNTSNFDAVVAVFDKKTNAYLQHAYLQASYSIEFSKLPETGVYWKCMLGKNWDSDKVFDDNKVAGGFDSIVQYQNWKTDPVSFTKNADDEYLLYVISPDLKREQYISNENEFFTK